MKQAFLSELEKLRVLLNNRPRESKADLKLKEYGYGRIDFYSKNIDTAVENVRKEAFDLGALYRDYKTNRDTIISILSIVQGDFTQKLDELAHLGSSLRQKNTKEERLRLSAPAGIPASIRPNVLADIRELEASFNAGCFRAATILCGRIIEICLHRKYYEATGLDILEKNPGIGLGKLIAKLAEKDVSFEPGLTQQIHLINQVRIHSVHVKRDSFYPSRQQTHAMVLYTMDVVGRMF